MKRVASLRPLTLSSGYGYLCSFTALLAILHAYAFASATATTKPGEANWTFDNTAGIVLVHGGKTDLWATTQSGNALQLHTETVSKGKTYTPAVSAADGDGTVFSILPSATTSSGTIDGASVFVYTTHVAEKGANDPGRECDDCGGSSSRIIGLEADTGREAFTATVSGRAAGVALGRNYLYVTHNDDEVAYGFLTVFRRGGDGEMIVVRRKGGTNIHRRFGPVALAVEEGKEVLYWSTEDTVAETWEPEYGGSVLAAYPHRAGDVWDVALVVFKSVDFARGAPLPMPGGGHVLVRTAYGQIIMYSTVNGEEIWSRDLWIAYDTFDELGIQPALSKSGKFIYLTLSGVIYCLRVDKGKTLWSVYASGPVATKIRVSPNDEFIYVLSNDRVISSLDSTTGETLWSHESSSKADIMGEFTLSENGQFLYYATVDGEIVALNTGCCKTEEPTMSPTSSSPTTHPTDRPIKSPSLNPTNLPSTDPIPIPSSLPTSAPTPVPSTEHLSESPIGPPSLTPTSSPTLSLLPSSDPSASPSSSPIMQIIVPFSDFSIVIRIASKSTFVNPHELRQITIRHLEEVYKSTPGYLENFLRVDVLVKNIRDRANGEGGQRWRHLRKLQKSEAEIQVSFGGSFVFGDGSVEKSSTLDVVNESAFYEANNIKYHGRLQNAHDKNLQLTTKVLYVSEKVPEGIFSQPQINPSKDNFSATGYVTSSAVAFSGACVLLVLGSLLVYRSVLLRRRMRLKEEQKHFLAHYDANRRYSQGNITPATMAPSPINMEIDDDCGSITSSITGLTGLRSYFGATRQFGDGGMSLQYSIEDRTSSSLLRGETMSGEGSCSTLGGNDDDEDDDAKLFASIGLNTPSPPSVDESCHESKTSHGSEVNSTNTENFEKAWKDTSFEKNIVPPAIIEDGEDTSDGSKGTGSTTVLDESLGLGSESGGSGKVLVDDATDNILKLDYRNINGNPI